MGLLSSNTVKQGTYWISLLLVVGRGFLAILLGAMVLYRPDSTRLLATFIGAYWMAAGFISVGAGLRSAESRILTILVGVIGVLAGLTVQTRSFWNPLVSEQIFIDLLGVVALITGVLHFMGWMTVWHEKPGRRTRSGYLLGLFEVGLGLVLLLADVVGPGVRLATIIWALGGGVILIFEGLFMHRKHRQAEAEAPVAASTEGKDAPAD